MAPHHGRPVVPVVLLAALLLSLLPASASAAPASTNPTLYVTPYVERGRAVDVRGSVPGAGPVRVALQRRERGRWVTVRTVRTRRSEVVRYARSFTSRLPAPRTGVLRVRACVAGTSRCSESDAARLAPRLSRSLRITSVTDAVPGSPFDESAEGEFLRRRAQMTVTGTADRRWAELTGDAAPLELQQWVAPSWRTISDSTYSDTNLDHRGRFVLWGFPSLAPDPSQFRVRVARSPQSRGGASQVVQASIFRNDRLDSLLPTSGALVRDRFDHTDRVTGSTDVVAPASGTVTFPISAGCTQLALRAGLRPDAGVDDQREATVTVDGRVLLRQTLTSSQRYAGDTQLDAQVFDLSGATSVTLADDPVAGHGGDHAWFAPYVTCPT